MKYFYTITLAFLFCNALFSQVYFVDQSASGANNGTSWTDAFTDLQVAINTVTASTGGEIWVKLGLYAPSMDRFGNTNPTDPRRKTFSNLGNPSPNVSIYGGFIGNETARNQRNVTSNITYLTGVFDLNYHIVTFVSVDNSFVIDGFTIEYGFANSSASYGTSRGGGVYADFSSGVFRNCTFANNTAIFGGAVFMGNSACTFEDCLFEYNQQASNSSQDVFILYHDDRAASGNPNFYKGCIFENNSSSDWPDYGIVDGSAYTIYEDCIFRDNGTPNTGTLFYTSKKPTSSNNSDVTFRNCLIYDNEKTTATNMRLFYNNEGILNIENCTIFDNGNNQPFSTTFYMKDETNIYNSIIQNAVDDEFFHYTFGPTLPDVNIFNNLSQGTLPLTANLGNNVMDTDPVFEDAAADDYRLQPCSPAFNKGNNAYLNVSSDFWGNTRTMYSTVDIGAYEIQKDRTVINIPEELKTADQEVTLADGWTRYYDCANNQLLLSVQKNGENIGTVGDGAFELKVSTNEDYNTGQGVELSSATYVSASTFYANNKSWSITPTNQPTSNVGVRFFYTPEDLNDINGSYSISSIEDIVLYKVNSSDAFDLNVASNDYQEYFYTTGSAGSSGFITGQEDGMDYVEFFVSSFSSGAMGAGDGSLGGALPVEILFFEVNKLNASQAKIEFELNTEFTTEVVIERSTDGYNWHPQKSFNFERGDQTGVFIDDSPKNGTNYYRLAMLEVPKATKSYSSIKSLDFSGTSFFKLKSTLISDQSLLLDADFDNANRDYQGYIFNGLGQVIKSFKINDPGVLNIDLSENVSAGTYWLSISEKGKINYRTYFIKM